MTTDRTWVIMAELRDEHEEWRRQQLAYLDRPKSLPLVKGNGPIQRPAAWLTCLYQGRECSGHLVDQSE